MTAIMLTVLPIFAFSVLFLVNPAFYLDVADDPAFVYYLELRGRGVQVTVMPREYCAESVVESLSAFPLQDARVLIPRAAVARDVLPKALAARGAQVDVVEAYRTVLPSVDLTSDICRLFEQGAIDAVTFTSSSTVTNFVMLIGEADLAQLLQDTVVACIGPITAETARSHGLTPTIVAHEYTVPALARAIVEYYESIQRIVLRTED